MLQFIPTSAIILLNVIVIFYVMREGGRSRSGLFLTINALSLILWAGGLEYWRAAGNPEWAMKLAGVGSMLIAANLFHFVLIHPHPLSGVKRQLPLAMLVFLPAIAIGLARDYDAASNLRRTAPLVYSTWQSMWVAEGGLPFVTTGVLLTTTLGMLIVRYNSVPSGPDRNLPRHLIMGIAAPALFMILFAFITTLHNVAIIPSPGLLIALVAQLGILAVIRQEEIERPLYLSRWMFYSIVVIIGFFIANITYTLYESVTASRLLAPTVQRTVLVTILIVVMAASIPRVQSFFDRLMFRRAYEYRQLVREAQLELYQTRQRLRAAERLSVVGEMAARIAHEIKNPLGPIKGYTQMMRERLEKMDGNEFPHRASFLRQLAIISEEVENIDRKVRQMLDIARKPELTVAPEDINQIVERAALLLRLEAETMNRETPGDRQTEIFEDLDSTLPKVECSRPRIEEALFNLCRNAFEAAGAAGTVTLRTRGPIRHEGREGVVIQIEDNGPGMTEAARQHLFEPFFTEKSDGTGLGLSIVKGHIDLHKGTIQFHPKPEGGTIAEIWLPLVGGMVPDAADAGEKLDSKTESRTEHVVGEPSHNIL